MWALFCTLRTHLPTANASEIRPFSFFHLIFVLVCSIIDLHNFSKEKKDEKDHFPDISRLYAFDAQRLRR
jgi:hypothetical protein